MPPDPRVLLPAAEDVEPPPAVLPALATEVEACVDPPDAVVVEPPDPFEPVAPPVAEGGPLVALDPPLDA
jgi:hypothetical protein